MTTTVLDKPVNPALLLTELDDSKLVNIPKSEIDKLPEKERNPLFARRLAERNRIFDTVIGIGRVPMLGEFEKQAVALLLHRQDNGKGQPASALFNDNDAIWEVLCEQAQDRMERIYNALQKAVACCKDHTVSTGTYDDAQGTTGTKILLDMVSAGGVSANQKRYCENRGIDRKQIIARTFGKK